MSFEKLLDHKCSIYHLEKSEESVGYGLPSSVSFSYPEKPDISEVPCHFGINSMSSSVKQGNPQNRLEEKLKLSLPAGTDIRINDKVVNCENGMEYTAELPRNIRNHHIIVYVKRVHEQEAL